MQELKARNRLPESEQMSSKQAVMSGKFEVEEDDDDDDDIGPKLEDRAGDNEDDEDEEDDMIGPSIDFIDKKGDVSQIILALLSIQFWF